VVAEHGLDLSRVAVRTRLSNTPLKIAAVPVKACSVSLRRGWRWDAWKACIAVLLSAALLLLGAIRFGEVAAFAQPSDAPIRDNPAMVQAVFLYSIGRYVEWPKSAFAKPSSPFVIAILGDETFGGTLDAIAAKKRIQGRRIKILHFATPKKFDQQCHILFVSSSVSAADQAAVIEKTKGKPIFVVGAMPGLAERGATANFVTDEDRLVIEINANAARKSQLRMDAKLLSLAKLVGASPTDPSN
jgi:hypothetical protein